LELAKTARRLAPEDAEVAHTLGRLAYQAQDHRWSLSLLQESARRLSQSPQVLFDLAWAYYSLGKLPEAQSSMQGALRADAAFAGADGAKRFLTMLELYKDPQKAGQAAAEVEAALKSDPDYVPALMVQATILERQGKAEPARLIYEKVLVRMPLFAPAAKHLAALYLARPGDDKRAFDLATKAREALPDDPEIAKTLGIVAFRRADYSRAAQLLKESARRRTDDPDVYYFLGMAHHHLGEKQESQAALHRALAMNVNPKFKMEAEKLIGKSN
jgi:uncharacterized protein HemY